jgi:hypothetical protein
MAASLFVGTRARFLKLALRHLHRVEARVG